MQPSDGGLPAYFPLGSYGISASHLVRFGLECDASAIRPDVILTPLWKADIFEEHATAIDPIAGDRVYDLRYKDTAVTLIRSGMGAPLTGDVVLCLACTPCKRILFTGFAGGLLPTQSVGDVLLPTHSISGDGFSRYLAKDLGAPESFLQPAFPDERLQRAVEQEVDAAVSGTGIKVGKGVVFSIDTIVSQYQHLEWITQSQGCAGIEMETAAVFNAARLVGIRAAAILLLSDVIPAHKTVFSGRSEAELRRKQTRRSVLAKVLLETYRNNTE